MNNKIKFWQLQKEAALTNKQCADLFEVSKRSIEKWRVDKPPAPTAVILYLELTINNNSQLKTVEKERDILELNYKEAMKTINIFAKKVQYLRNKTQS